MTMTMPNMMIGLIKDGLRKDVKPFGTPEDSFVTLLNAYQYRGRITRRPGYTLLARLALSGVFQTLPVMGLLNRNKFGINLQDLIAFDTAHSYLYTASTDTFDLLPSVMPVTWNGQNYNFYIGTNYAGSLWVTNGVPGLNGVAISAMTNSGSNTIVTTATPHGFTNGQYVTFINVNPLPGSSTINGLSLVISAASGSVFTVVGNYTAYSSGGFALNNQVQTIGQDGIRYYGDLAYGPSSFSLSWANYNPPINPYVALAGALLIFPYRGYLVFLNTWEGNDPAKLQNFGNRARWTQIGTPYYSNPVPGLPNLQTADPLAARDDIFGRGGANDAPTQEVIVGAAFIRDILVVYFEKSTWRLRFVNNTQNPFVWERVNVELGSDCTYATIPFDKGVMTIGRRGILISDGNDTMRFDEKIPDDIFDIRVLNNGLDRVSGIRTFRSKLCYWTFPDDENENTIYPNKVLVYNYESKTWAFFDDTFTTFGYYYPSSTTPSLTWNDLTDPWSSYSEMSPDDAVSDTGYETIVAGNQQGFVFRLEQTSAQNDPSLYIAAITTGAVTVINSPNHNLNDEDWVQLTGISGVVDNFGLSLNGRNFKISTSTPAMGNDPNNFVIQGFEILDAGNFSTSTFTYTAFDNVLPGSVTVYVGAVTFTDGAQNGILFPSSGGGTGTINYATGEIVINFASPIVATEIYVSVVSYDPDQELSPIVTSGSYSGTSGLIAKISNFDIVTKIFNFFGQDKRARLSKIDFYVDSTTGGQFECDVLGDSSNEPINKPLADNPQSNIVLTSPNPYQIGIGDESIFRLYCDALAQTLQLELSLNDQQMATSLINDSNVDLLAMIFSMRQGGRLV
jgi:hypothetical protein